MKRIIIVLALYCAASVSFGLTNMTQSASSVAADLPRIEFYKQINDAVTAITKNDLPALFNRSNGKDAVQVGTFTNGQLSVVFGTTYSTAPKVVVWSTDASSVLFPALTNRMVATGITVTNFVPFSNVPVGGCITNGAYFAIP